MNPIRPTTGDIKKQGRIFGHTDLPLKNWDYRDHQVKAFLIATKLNNCALFMGQRTGKTPVAIAVMGKRFLEGKIRRVLVISPFTVMGTWQRDGFEKLADFPVRIEILEGSIKGRANQLTTWVDTPGELQVVITNYDAIAGLKKELQKWKPDMIVCDESQKIKNGRTQRSRAVHSLRKAKYRMILSGTPITKSPLDIFSQFKFLDDSIFGSSFIQFRDRYAVMGGYMGHEVKGYKIFKTSLKGDRNPRYIPNLEREFFERLNAVSYRVTLEEIGNLEPIVPQALYAILEPSARQIYDAMEETSLITLQGGIVTAPIILTQMMRLQQIAGGFVTDENGVLHQVSNAKLKVLKSKLEDLLEEDKKVVIFARYTPEVKAIANLLKEMKVPYHTLEGAIKGSSRREAIRNDFQNNPATKVIVVQISTGGEGITLSSAKAEIFYSCTLSFMDYDQARARILAMDDPDKEIYHIVAQDTKDERIMDILAQKRDIARMTVDDLKELFLEGVRERMAKVVGREAREILINMTDQVPQDELYDDLETLLEELAIELNTKEQEGVNDDPGVLRKDFTPKPKVPKDKKDSKVLTDGDVVTVKALAGQLNTEPKKLRKWLRANLGQCDGRWEWSKDDPQLTQIIATFSQK